jgi:hypothetical protein
MATTIETPTGNSEFKNADASHPDGFRGARDASILASYDREGNFVLVQAVDRTKDLLRRAGVRRIRSHEFYKVSVSHCKRVNGLQLA